MSAHSTLTYPTAVCFSTVHCTGLNKYLLWREYLTRVKFNEVKRVFRYFPLTWEESFFWGVVCLFTLSCPKTCCSKICQIKCCRNCTNDVLPPRLGYLGNWGCSYCWFSVLNTLVLVKYIYILMRYKCWEEKIILVL